MPSAGVSSNSVPPIIPRCPTCNEKMVFVSVSPTCQSVIYGYICRNDGDRLSGNPFDLNSREWLAMSCSAGLSHSGERRSVC